MKGIQEHALTAFALLVFLILFVSGASKPLQLDNMDFPAAAAQTAVSGVPVYYRGEENPRALGLYHPPLYIYLLAAWIRVFGFAATQVRMFGMLCVLLQGLVTLALLRELFGRDLIARCSPWFWLIFLLNPYTIQGASIADIDTTIYGPLMGAALLAVIRLSWRDGVWREDAIRRREYAVVIAAVTLCLWAKLTTALLLFPFLFLLMIPRLRIARAAAATIAISIAAVAAFLVTYRLYGKLSGMNVGYTFAFTWASFLGRGSSQTPGLMARIADFRNNAQFMIPFMVRWTGLAPWLAGAAMVCVAFQRAWAAKDRRAAHLGLLILLALLCTAYYCGKVETFGAAPFKYVFVFWGLELGAVILLTFTGKELWSVDGMKRQWTRYGSGIVALAGLTALCTARFLGDHVILFGAGGNYKWPLVLPGLAILAGATLRWSRFGRILLATGFALYCGVSAGVALTQSKANYATQYDYGQTGFMDTVSFLRLNTAPTDIISSMKDIGFSADRRYFENYGALYGDDRAEQRLITAISSGQVAYEVFTEGRGQDELIMRPSLRTWITEHCDLVRSFGNYRIYKYRAAS